MQHNVTDNELIQVVTYSNKKNCKYNQNYDFQQKTLSLAP